MPYYEVLHSYPLTAAQKSSLAQAITALHSTTFLTPSLFVNVVFTSHNAAESTYFVAGTPSLKTSNRILAMVRTSEKRTKAVFDALAAKIEAAWYDVLLGQDTDTDTDKRNGNGDITQSTKLLFVVFHPMIAARENGVTIPGAGEEGNWLKDNMAYFKEQADKGDEHFVQMIKEVDTREDLKKLLS